MSMSPRTTDGPRPALRRPRRSVRSTTLRATAVSLVAALGIGGAMGAQMAAGKDPALRKKDRPAQVRRAPAPGAVPAAAVAPAPVAPPPVVTRSS